MFSLPLMVWIYMSFKSRVLEVWLAAHGDPGRGSRTLTVRPSRRIWGCALMGDVENLRPLPALLHVLLTTMFPDHTPKATGPSNHGPQAPNM